MTGQLSSVTELIAKQQDQCSIKIEWEPPFLLPGLYLLYKISTSDGIEHETNDTYYIYYPENVTRNIMIKVQVKAFNKSIIGIGNSTDVTFSTGT